MDKQRTLFHVTAQAGLGGLFLIIPGFLQALTLDDPQPILLHGEEGL